MWVFAMFDLPTDTKEARRAYTEFRNGLLNDGFIMLQYSIYARHCASEENAVLHARRIKSSLPPDGEVRVITLTDKQFERMLVFHGNIRKLPEHAPEQISFF